MKYFLKTLTLFLFIFNANSQTLLNTSCNQSTTGIQVILAPNSSTTIPSNINNFGNYYLCGPNTNMYDTLTNANGCRNVFVNSGCTLITKSTGCFAYEVIYAKNSSTVVIRAGANVSTKIVYEPLAVIINQAGIVNTTSCSSITFPTVNCGITSLTENIKMNSQIELFPNPIKNKLQIEFQNEVPQGLKLNITNSLGQTLYSLDNPNQKQEIDLSFLSAGIYYLKVQNNAEQKVMKIIKE